MKSSFSASGQRPPSAWRRETWLRAATTLEHNVKLPVCGLKGFADMQALPALFRAIVDERGEIFALRRASR
jgi:hypothetical protein